MSLFFSPLLCEGLLLRRAFPEYGENRYAIQRYCCFLAVVAYPTTIVFLLSNGAFLYCRTRFLKRVAVCLFFFFCARRLGHPHAVCAGHASNDSSLLSFSLFHLVICSLFPSNTTERNQFRTRAFPKDLIQAQPTICFPLTAFLLL